MNDLLNNPQEEKLISIEENENGDYDYTCLEDYLRSEETAKLLPDLDFTKVRLNKRQQFLNFCKIYSVLNPESEPAPKDKLMTNSNPRYRNSLVYHGANEINI